MSLRIHTLEGWRTRRRALARNAAGTGHASGAAGARGHDAFRVIRDAVSWATLLIASILGLLTFATETHDARKVVLRRQTNEYLSGRTACTLFWQSLARYETM